ncbi:hypothetical protein BI295_04900, partial [Mycobacterium avium subsp. hominissuis]
DVDRVRCGHRVNLLRLTWSSFEESRDDRPLPGYDTPPHVTSSYTTSLDATLRDDGLQGPARSGLRVVAAWLRMASARVIAT